MRHDKVLLDLVFNDIKMAVFMNKTMMLLSE